MMAVEPLDAGDMVEYSVSAQVREGGMESWHKFGATVVVRPGESGEEAAARATDFVHASLTQAIEDAAGT